MFEKADLTISEVEPPFNKWCDSGHVAPDTFKRDGQDLPIRFFNVTHSTLKGTYCEVCLTIANYLKLQNKGK